MKKFKFFALAALLMGSTSVFAQEVTPSDGTWKYEVISAAQKTAKLVSLVDSKKGTLETLEIPAQVTGEGGAKYNIVEIADGAFEGDQKIKTVTFTTAITAIGENAFKDVSNMTTVTFPEGSKLATIGNGAFANTFALEKIDLSNTKVYDLSAVTPFVETIYHEAVEAHDAVLYANAAEYNAAKGTELTDEQFAALEDANKIKTPATEAADAWIELGSSNVALEEIVLPAKTTAIGIALAKLRALKKVNIKDTKIRFIGAGAFAGDKNFTELELPAVYKYDEDTGDQLTTPETTTLAENSLDDSFIQKLTINGNIDEGGIAPTGAETLTQITFNGEVATGAITAGAFAGNLKLAKVSFNGKVNAGAIIDGSFVGCADPDTEGAAKSLAFSIAAGKATAVVFAGAEGDEAEDAGMKAFSAEIVEPAAKKNVAITAPDAAVGANVPYRATFKPTATPASQVKVYGTSTFYGKFMNTGDAPVNIKREVATVYSAYVDGSKLYMDPLQVFDGNQIIAPNEAVIVKTTSPKEAADKSYNYIELAALPEAEDMPAAGHTMRLDAMWEDAEEPDLLVNGIVNDIEYIYIAPNTTPNYRLAADIKDLNPTKVLYVVGDLTKGLKWQTPKDNVKLYNNTLYVFADEETESGRLEIIWLDGSEEEATAIKTVKSAKAENGVLYNLAGQKVNAAYKGVVIKDGKKMIMK